jgi:hypothetical protein
MATVDGGPGRKHPTFNIEHPTSNETYNFLDHHLCCGNWVPLVTNPAAAGGVLVLTNMPDPTTNNFWRIRAVP